MNTTDAPMGPSSREVRIGAISLGVIAVADFGLIASWTTDWVPTALMLPLIGALIIFNFGYIYSGTKIGLFKMKRARIGAIAVLLNLAPLLFDQPTSQVVGFFAVAAAVAIAGALLMLKEVGSA